MKKMKHFVTVVLTALMLVPASLMAQQVAGEVAKIFPKAKDTKEIKNVWTEVYGKRNKVIGYVAYSKPYSNGVKGYNGETPVMVAFDQSKKILTVVLLKNNETPNYVNRVQAAGYFDSWNGLTIKQALSKQVDAVSGATYTSRGVQKSLKALLEHLSKTVK